jgi:HlyD family secretion protein
MSQQLQSQLLSLPGLEDEGEDTSLAAPSPPWWRRRGTIIGIAVLLLIILLGGLFLFLMNRRPRVTYQVQPVTQGNLSLTISATGPLQGGVYNINFTGTGKIAQIDVTVGEPVVQGQIVAKLDKTSLQDALNSARSAVSTAQTALSNDQNSAGATGTQSSANTSAAKTTLSNAKTNLSKVQSVSQDSVNAAQTALNNAENNLSTAQQQAQANIATAQATETSALAACPTSAAVTAADTDADGDATTPDNDSDDAAVATALQNCINVATTTLNQAEAAANASVAAAQATVNSMQAALNTANSQASANNAAAQAQVNTAQKGVTTTNANAGVSNTSSQGLTNSAQSQLQTALVGLQTAEHNLANATLRAPHSGIVTVINGTIGGTPGVPANVSASTTGTSGTFIQIVDSSTLQVMANVNETDTANLRVGDPAKFSVNAYGTRLFTGTVTAISPNGQTVSNVVTYPVIISVDTTDLQGTNLLPGMTANVTIDVLQRIDVLLIPVDAVNFARIASTSNPTTGAAAIVTQQAVSTAMQQASQMLQQLESQNPAIAAESPIPAFVLEEPSAGHFIVKPVVLGLTDGTVYEVLSGLKAGENIIVGTTSASSRSATGGGGGGG